MERFFRAIIAFFTTTTVLTIGSAFLPVDTGWGRWLIVQEIFIIPLGGMLASIIAVKEYRD